MNNEQKTLTCIGVTATVLVILVASVAITGFVLERLWAWFIIPLGLPPITFVHALGLSVLVGALGIRKVESSNEKATWGKVATSLLPPLILLGLGWILHQFM